MRERKDPLLPVLNASLIALGLLLLVPHRPRWAATGVTILSPAVACLIAVSIAIARAQRRKTERYRLLGDLVGAACIVFMIALAFPRRPAWVGVGLVISMPLMIALGVARLAQVRREHEQRARALPIYRPKR